jgi:hypothetical protein
MSVPPPSFSVHPPHEFTDRQSSTHTLEALMYRRVSVSLAVPVKFDPPASNAASRLIVVFESLKNSVTTCPFAAGPSRFVIVVGEALVMLRKLHPRTEGVVSPGV